MHAYGYLAVAIATEIMATVALKSTEGWSRLVPTLFVIAGYVCSFGALGLALKQGLNLNVGYAIWSGVGTAVIAVAGVLLYGEHLSRWGVLGIAFIVLGVMLLHLGHGAGAATSGA